MNTKPLNILVLDDSAMVRQVLSKLLSREPGFEVVTAATGTIAFSKIAKSRPDVIVLDLEMPGMDGFTFLQKLMQNTPIPVVICSDLAARGSDAALRALELGAVDIITKPNVGVEEFLQESAVRIIDLVKAASQARLLNKRLVIPREARDHTPPKPSRPVAPTTQLPPAGPVVPKQTGSSRPETPTIPIPGNGSDLVMCVGASTGGTEALLQLLQAMPPDCPPIAIVQHMPAGFTAAFAKRLDSLCQIEVIEGKSGDLLIPGRAIIAAGDRHMLVQRTQRGLAVEVTDGALVTRHRPSCNVLFKSAARAMGARVVGVIMTGMGADGAEGILELRNGGARTIAQDEESCVVYGMPKVAVELGGVQEIVPLDRIAGAMLRLAGYSGNAAAARH